MPEATANGYNPKPCYVVRGCNKWGKGKDPTEAFINARFPEEFAVHWLPEGTTDVHVDEMGAICWKWENGVIEGAGPQEVEVNDEVLQSILYAASDMVADACSMVMTYGVMSKRSIGNLEAQLTDISMEISDLVPEE